MKRKRNSIETVSYCMKRCLLTQSVKRLILFILMDFFLVTVFVSAGDGSQTAATSQEPETTILESPRFILNAGTGYWIPILDEGLWKNYFTTGLHMDFTTCIPRLLIRLSLEGGQVNMDEEKAEDNYPLIKNLKLIHTSLSFSYDIPIIKGRFLLRPRIGLSNAMIERGDLSFKNLFTIMSESENEFGVLGGIEPVYIIKPFIVSLSVNGEILFSSPDPFITGNISLTAGVIF